jgi:hypothetical protein
LKTEPQEVEVKKEDSKKGKKTGATTVNFDNRQSAADCVNELARLVSLLRSKEGGKKIKQRLRRIQKSLILWADDAG